MLYHVLESKINIWYLDCGKLAKNYKANFAKNNCLTKTEDFGKNCTIHPYTT